MEHIKSFIKNNIIGFLLGIVLSGVLCVSASSLLSSNSISYSNTVSNLESTNVQDAIDEIFSIKSNSSSKNFWEHDPDYSYHKESGSTGYTDFYIDITLEEDLDNNILLIYTYRQMLVDDIIITTLSGDVSIKLVESFSDIYNSPLRIYSISGKTGARFRVKQSYTESFNNRILDVRIYSKNTTTNTERANYKSMYFHIYSNGNGGAWKSAIVSPDFEVIGNFPSEGALTGSIEDDYFIIERYAGGGDWREALKAKKKIRVLLYTGNTISEKIYEANEVIIDVASVHSYSETYLAFAFDA